MRSRPLSLTESTAFTLAELEISCADVVLSGIGSGEWTTFVGETEDAILSLAAGASPPSLDVVRTAAERFRRERGLLTTEELDDWLDARGLDRDDLASSLERRVVVQLSGDPRRGENQAAAPGLRAAVEVDAWTSGVLESCARRLLDLVVGSRSAGQGAAAEPDSQRIDEVVAAAHRDPTAVGTMTEASLRTTVARLLRWENAFREFAERAATQARIEAVLHEHASDWTTFVYDVLTCPTEEVAKEIRLAVRDDGADPGDLADSLGLTSQRFEHTAAELDPATHSSLVTAIPGSVQPAAPRNGQWTLVSLVDKRRPTMSDAALVGRATSMVIEDALRATRGELVDWKL